MIQEKKKTNPAEMVWSIDHLRESILSSMPRNGLFNLLTLSKEDHDEVIKELYHTLELTDSLDHALQERLSEEKYERYMSYVRYLTIYDRPRKEEEEEDEENTEEDTEVTLDNFLPSHLKDLQIYPLRNQSCSTFSIKCQTTDQPETYFEHMSVSIPTALVTRNIRNFIFDPMAPVSERKIKDNSKHRFIKNFRMLIIHDLAWRNTPEYIRKGECELLLDFWLRESHVFEYPIKELILVFNLTCEMWIKSITRIDNEGVQIPSELVITPREKIENDSKTILDVIQALSPMIKSLMIIPHPNVQLNTNIYDFFKQDFQFPEENKLTSLNIWLKAKYELSPILSPLKLGYTGNPINLEEFTITILIPDNLEDESPYKFMLNYIPSLSGIARGMSAIGGTNCKYYLKIQSRISLRYYAMERNSSSARKIREQKEVSDILTKLLREEMVKMWIAEKEDVSNRGWKHLQGLDFLNWW